MTCMKLESLQRTRRIQTLLCYIGSAAVAEGRGSGVTRHHICGRILTAVAPAVLQSNKAFSLHRFYGSREHIHSITVAAGRGSGVAVNHGVATLDSHVGNQIALDVNRMDPTAAKYFLVWPNGTVAGPH